MITHAKPENGGDYFGFGEECGRRNIKQQLRLREVAGKHGQNAVLRVPRFCRDAERNLFLDHDRRIRHGAVVVKHVKQNGGCDIIGNVADNADARAGRICKRGEIDFKKVRFHHFHAAAGKHQTHRFHHPRIDVNNLQPPSRRREKPGQCSFARTDLDKNIRRLNVDRRNNLPDDVVILKEMLSK